MKVIPTLTEDSWLTVSSKNSSLGVLFSYFLYSDYNQSETFVDQVCSMPYVLMKAGADVDSFVSILQNTLEEYMKRYYEEVFCEVKDKSPSNVTASATVSVYLSVKDINGVVTDLSKAIEYQDGKLKNVFNINNYGV